MTSFERMEFRILGRMTVVDGDGRNVDIGGALPRRLLALLLVADGRAVTTDAISDALWGDSPPATPLGTIQSYVSRLRRALGARTVVWEPPGYRLAIDRAQVDAWRFERLAADGHVALQQEDASRARDLLVRAEALWNGPAVPELRDLDAGMGAAARLDELRLVAIEDRLTADLQLGHSVVAAAELGELVRLHPFREGLRAKLALALYRSGRQADALRTIADARRMLVDELGLEPSRELRDLETSILDHDPALQLTSGAETAARSRGTAPSPGPARLLGRDAELEALLTALDEARASGRLVVVEGEPGIGKTRLAEQLAAEATDRGAIVAWGRCHDGAGAPVYWPWLAALRTIVEAVPEAGAGLEGLLAPDPSSNPLDISPFELDERVARALAAASADRLVVVVLDDVQWADAASMELLAHVARRADEASVLVVVTVRQLEVGRSDHVVSALAAVARRPSSRRLVLRGLEDSAAAELVSDATGQPARVELAAAINRRADGNPFYASELARLLQSRGVDSPDEIADLHVPTGVRDVIRERLAHLPAVTTEILQVAAVIGRDVPAVLLARALDGFTATGVEGLEPAFVQRFVAEAGDAPGTYRFSHGLVREVIVDDLSSLRRARVHLQVADALEQLGAGDDDAEILAEHLDAAIPLVDGDRAAAALERAATVAIRRSAYAAADGLLERALRWRRVASPSPEHRSAELDTLVSAFFVERVVRGHRAAIEGEVARRARDLAHELGRTDVTARLLWAEWVGADKAGDLRRAAGLATELRATCEQSPDPHVQALGLHAIGVTAWHAGELTEAVRALDAAVELNRAESPPKPIEVLTSALRPTTWPLGHPVVAFVHALVDVDPSAAADRFERMAAAHPHAFARGVVWMFAGYAALATGDAGGAATYARRGVETGADLRTSYWDLGNQLCLGAARCAAGDVDEGLAIVEAARPDYLGTDTQLFLPLVDARLAEGLIGAGRLAEAQGYLGVAEAGCAAGHRWIEPVVLSVAAAAAGAAGASDEEVAGMLARAREVAVAQGSHAIVRDVDRRYAARLGR